MASNNTVGDTILLEGRFYHSRQGVVTYYPFGIISQLVYQMFSGV